MVTINSKGLTLLEVLITLAILGIIVVSFFSLFTRTNLNINYSGKKIKAVIEAKSILDEIHSEVVNTQKENDQDYDTIVQQVLNSKDYKDNYEIFTNDNNFHKYNNKIIHCLIEEQDIDIKPTENSNNTDLKMQKIKVILFYDNGKGKVELSTYTPIEEDENEK